MNIIVFKETTSAPLRLQLTRGRVIAVVSGVMMSLVAVIGGLGFFLGGQMGWQRTEASARLAEIKTELANQYQTIEVLRTSNDRHVNALALRLGEMKARTVRLEALGDRLTRIGQLDDGEFDFSSPPALGGPGRPENAGELEQLDLDSELAALAIRLNDQGRQLSVLETLIANRELEDGLQPAGRPISRGWLSSYYGKRADPFNGQVDHHPGIDFTGPPETDILAVAGGMVVWSGMKPDYGNSVDIDHGNGYVTRYAHNKLNRVHVGERVAAGQVIAVMGSTGRSTSRHVHFEVWFDGHRINPYDVVMAGR
jgi:murein DD-endopeptidase MepM/ murein hydrolase activator NlpD